MKGGLIGVALLGAAVVAGRRRRRLFESVLKFQHPLIKLADEFAMISESVELTTMEPEDCSREKAEITKAKRLLFRLNSKINSFEKSLPPNAPDEKFGVIVWALHQMENGSKSLKAAEENYSFHCKDFRP